MSSPVTENADPRAVVRGIARATESTQDQASSTTERSGTVRLEVPVRTIVRVALALLVIWLCIQIWNIFLLVFIAFLTAAALAPPAETLQRRGWSEGRSVAAVVLSLLVLLGVGLGFLIPQAISEGRDIAADLPTYVEQGNRILGQYPALQEQVSSLADRGAANGETVSASQVVSVGSTIATGIANVLFVVVLAVYLLIEGERVYGWIAHYLNPVQQIRFRRTMPEVVKIVSGYVIGQAITSLLFGIFAFAVLAIAGVPGALVLAVLAGLLDAIPLVGVPVATIPAVLLAATVSLPTAAVVLGLYVAYQQVENYVIVPRIYGKSLQVSPIGILLGVVVGSQLLGIIGILLALPLVAAVSVIERIWTEEVKAEDRLAPPATPPVVPPTVSAAETA